jgi:hypothetical protein
MLLWLLNQRRLHRPGTTQGTVLCGEYQPRQETALLIEKEIGVLAPAPRTYCNRGIGSFGYVFIIAGLQIQLMKRVCSF